jgi:hypothetical protein
MLNEPSTLLVVRPSPGFPRQARPSRSTPARTIAPSSGLPPAPSATPLMVPLGESLPQGAGGRCQRLRPTPSRLRLCDRGPLGAAGARAVI